jgi:aminoglycoside 3-N-acetyltransferase
MIESVLARAPILEVAARLVYWRSPTARKFGDKLRAYIARRSKLRVEAPRPVVLSKVIEAMRDLGVREGDLLIVHSSYAELRSSGATPAEVISAMRGLIGPSGTLAMPAIPLIKGEPKGSDLFKDESYDRVLEFDVASRRIATGELPKVMMQTPGAVRSRFPGNSMVAIGPAAEAMMAGNLDAPSPTACGPGSSWEFGFKRDAAIISIGIDMVHSLTMVHVIEDAFEDDWPVEGWYRTRRFAIRDGDFTRDLTIRERKHGWSQFLAQRAFSRNLYRSGVASTRLVDGLPIHFCRAGALIRHMSEHPSPTYPYVFPLGYPRKRAVAG